MNSSKNRSRWRKRMKLTNKTHKVKCMTLSLEAIKTRKARRILHKTTRESRGKWKMIVPHKLCKTKECRANWQINRLCSSICQGLWPTTVLIHTAQKACRERKPGISELQKEHKPLRRLQHSKRRPKWKQNWMSSPANFRQSSQHQHPSRHSLIKRCRKQQKRALNKWSTTWQEWNNIKPKQKKGSHLSNQLASHK